MHDDTKNIAQTFNNCLLFNQISAQNIGGLKNEEKKPQKHTIFRTLFLA